MAGTDVRIFWANRTWSRYPSRAGAIGAPSIYYGFQRKRNFFASMVDDFLSSFLFNKLLHASLSNLLSASNFLVCGPSCNLFAPAVWDAKVIIKWRSPIFYSLDFSIRRKLNNLFYQRKAGTSWSGCTIIFMRSTRSLRRAPVSAGSVSFNNRAIQGRVHAHIPSFKSFQNGMVRFPCPIARSNLDFCQL